MCNTDFLLSSRLLDLCVHVYHNTPVRTLIAPCTALTSPLTSISISSVNSCGHASGQSQ